MSKSSEIYFNSTIAFIASKQKLQSHELLSLYLNSICSISMSAYQRNKPYSEMKNVAIKIVQWPRTVRDLNYKLNYLNLDWKIRTSINNN